MLSRDANYNMDQALSEISSIKNIINAKAETQVILQLMVEKGIVDREEVADMRAKVKRQLYYKAAYDFLDGTKIKDGAIKSGMVIHCTEKEQARALLEHLDKEGYSCHVNLIDWENRETCYKIEYSKWVYRNTVRNFFRDEITEFSDLIEPDTPNNSDPDLTIKKASKPVEVEEGYFCELYEKRDGSDFIVLGYNMWNVDKDTAIKDAQDKAKKRVVDTRKPCYTRITYKCRVKEGK